MLLATAHKMARLIKTARRFRRCTSTVCVAPVRTVSESMIRLSRATSMAMKPDRAPSRQAGAVACEIRSKADLWLGSLALPHRFMLATSHDKGPSNWQKQANIGLSRCETRF